MPELPEAEANRRRVEAHCLNRTIGRVVLGNDTKHVELPTEEERDALTGRQFTETRRHGKLIFAGSSTGPWIAVHLGMSGSLRPWDADDGPPDYARITFEFEGDRRLSFRCPRKLGWVNVTDDPDAYVAGRGFGPDALKIGRDTFRDVIGSSKGALKSALIQQKKLAGIGNLWSDEILYRTGLMPDATGTDLSEAKLDEVFDQMHAVLDAVSDTDMDYSKLPDDWLIHHRTAGDDCPRCGGTIAKKTVGGRTAYHCPDHQGAA